MEEDGDDIGSRVVGMESSEDYRTIGWLHYIVDNGHSYVLLCKDM